MVILEPAELKETCRRENGVSYCPFQVLGRDTAGGVAIGKAVRGKQARLCARQGAYAHDQGCACAG